jgi:hypothetical protein
MRCADARLRDLFPEKFKGTPLRRAFLRFQNWPIVFVAPSSHSRAASSAMSSTALKNFTAFGFGLPNGRSLAAATRMATSPSLDLPAYSVIEEIVEGFVEEFELAVG